MEPFIRNKERGFDAAWEMSSEDGEYGPKSVMAVLSVGHSSQRKAFYASVQRETWEVGKYGTSRSFMLFNGVTLMTEPVARYSAKRMKVFFDRAMKVLDIIRRDPESAELVLTEKGRESVARIQDIFDAESMAA
jgi:hypothetical protein